MASKVDRSRSAPGLEFIPMLRKLERKDTLTNLICEACMDKMNYDDGLGNAYNVSFRRKLRIIEDQKDVYDDDQDFKKIVTCLRDSINKNINPNSFS